MKKEWNGCCIYFSCFWWCDYICFALYVCIDICVGYVAYNVTGIFLFDFWIALDAVDDFNVFDAVVEFGNFIMAVHKGLVAFVVCCLLFVVLYCLKPI